MVDETRRSGAQNAGPAPRIDLSGKWKLDSAPNETVVIVHFRETGKVIAKFSPAALCLGQPRITLFDTFVKTTSESASDSKLALEDATYWSCTGDSYMIPACGTAVWASKMRNVIVSPDGNTISGERFYEGLTWDGVENQQYLNCRRDPGRNKWVSWKLTRTVEQQPSPTPAKEPPESEDPDPPTGELEPADLVLTAEPGADKAKLGEKIGYKFKIMNKGPGDAQVAVFKINLGNGRLIKVVASQGECPGSGVGVNCKLGLLKAGDTTDVMVSLMPRVTGVLRAAGRASAASPDPDMSNNLKNVTVRILPSSP